MKAVIILGGAFDPIHNGHIMIGKQSLIELQADELWLLPAPNSRWKETKSSIDFRLEMLRLVCQNEKNFTLCEAEVHNEGESYTYDTMIKIKKSFPTISFYFLIGSDQLDKLDSWYEIEKLAKLINFVVYQRPNYPIHYDNLTKFSCKLVDSTKIDISSTMIRQELDFNLLPSYLKDFLLFDLTYHKQKLKTLIDSERYRHSLSVLELAGKIAQNNNINITNARIAGLLHDCAKNLSKAEEQEIITQYFYKYKDYQSKVLHQFTSAYLASTIFKIKDPEIVEAIKWHTTGKGDMTILEKIIYAADKIEDSRNYDSSSLIKACLDDIDRGFEAVIRDNWNYFQKKKIEIKIPEMIICFKQYKGE